MKTFGKQLEASLVGTMKDLLEINDGIGGFAGGGYGGSAQVQNINVKKSEQEKVVDETILRPPDLTPEVDKDAADWAKLQAYERKHPTPKQQKDRDAYDEYKMDQYRENKHKNRNVDEAENDFLNPMKKTLNRNLLKYAAGRHIFCPGCENIMDHKNTVVMTNNKTGHTTVNCGDCHDKLINKLGEKHGHDVIKKHLADNYDIVDGRPARKQTKEPKPEKQTKQPKIKGQGSFRFKPGPTVESVKNLQNDEEEVKEEGYGVGPAGGAGIYFSGDNRSQFTSPENDEKKSVREWHTQDEPSHYYRDRENTFGKQLESSLVGTLKELLEDDNWNMTDADRQRTHQQFVNPTKKKVTRKPPSVATMTKWMNDGIARATDNLGCFTLDISKLR